MLFRRRSTLVYWLLLLFFISFRDTSTHTNRHQSIQTYKTTHTNKHTKTQTNTKTYRHTNRHTHAYTQTSRHTEKQTDTQTDNRTHRRAQGHTNPRQDVISVNRFSNGRERSSRTEM